MSQSETPADGGPPSPEPTPLDERLRAALAAEPNPGRAESRRVGDAMRLVIDRLVATGAPPAELAKAADQL